MNITFVLPYLADRFGGTVSVTKGMGQALAKLGYEVSYWTAATASDRMDVPPLGNVHVCGVNWPRSWHRSKDFVDRLSQAACSIDLMHINGFWLHPTYAATRIAHANKVPYILTPAGALQPLALRNGLAKRVKKAAYFQLLARSMMERAACLQACAASEAEHFRRMGYKGPVTIIPNGVDIADFSDGDDTEANEYWPHLKDRPVVLFMSRLTPIKGLDVLLPAWANLVRSKRHRDALLVVAGPDERGYGKTVNAMLDKHGIRHDVLLTGMVQGAKKRALMQRADVFVLPSHSENFGIVVAEALACGTPVITTTGTPWQQLEEVDAGRWVDPSPPDLRRALGELLDMSPSQRKAMGLRGRTLVKQHYTWEKVGGQFLTVCDCILRGKSIPLYPESKRMGIV